MGQSAHEKLRYAQELLSHQIPSGDIAEVFERALDALIPQLERRKFAAATRPSRFRRPTRSSRHIPAEVLRTVWERDQGQCTFVSDTGRRCPARKHIEFDHIQEVARGGQATVDGIRLRCRAHNQFGAECTFGAEFMRHKRLAAAEVRAAAQAQAAARTRERAATAAARAQAEGAEQAEELEVVPWLRALGFGAGESRRAATLCKDMHDASLEERVRAALSFFHVRGARVVRAACQAAPERPERGRADPRPCVG